MALVDDIAADSSVAFDTDALIYYVEEHPQFFAVVEPVVELVFLGRVQAHISTINLLEVLVRPLREGRSDLAATYLEKLTNPDDFQFHAITRPIAEGAAAIRAEFRLGVADAIVAATALEAGCDYLVTNNGDDFKRIPGIRLLVIKDYLTA